MRNPIDIVALIILVSVGFITWYDTPLGNKDFSAKTANAKKEQKITIDSLKANQRVYGYVDIYGKAQVTQSEYKIRVKDAISGEIFSEEKLDILSPEIGEFGPWREEINFSKFPEGKNLLIEVFKIPLKGKETESTFSVPVIVWKDRSIFE